MVTAMEREQLCRRCRERLPLSKFGPRAKTCRRCVGERHKRRQAEAGRSERASKFRSLERQLSRAESPEQMLVMARFVAEEAFGGLTKMIRQYVDFLPTASMQAQMRAISTLLYVCAVCELNSSEALERDDLSDMELIEGIRGLLEERGITLDQLIERLDPAPVS